MARVRLNNADGKRSFEFDVGADGNIPPEFALILLAQDQATAVQKISDRLEAIEHSLYLIARAKRHSA